MPSDETRSARRIATLVAIPVALLVGVLLFAAMGGFWGGPGGAGGSGGSGRDRAGQPAQTSQPTGPVTMPAPALTPKVAVACRALLGEVPQAAGDAPRRPVSAGPQQNAAYGTPPITLACGGPQFVPPSVPPGGREDLYVGLAHVCWYSMRNEDRSTTWHTMVREVPVTFTVPAPYEGPSQRVIVFSGSILATLRTVTQIPTGCQF